jgi:hypothetical protein
MIASAAANMASHDPSVGGDVAILPRTHSFTLSGKLWRPNDTLLS